MKETFMAHRDHYHYKLLALLFVVVAASLVGYVAWQSRVIMETLDEMSDSLVVVPAPTPTGELYFSAASVDTPDKLATYVYEFATGQWGEVFDYPGHTNFSPVSAVEAFVTMPSVDIPTETLTAENAARPAFLRLDTGNFNYLDTPAGYRESHYRLSPGADSALAYMQQIKSVEVTDLDTNPIAIENWEVVIHRSVPLNNIVIADAMYPQWISLTEVLMLQSSGLTLYDIKTDELYSIEIPHTDLSAANEYGLSAPNKNGNRMLIMTASGENSLSIMTEYQYPSDTTNQIAFETVSAISDSSAVYINPVVSLDGSQFGLLRHNYEKETGILTSVFQTYHFYTQQMTADVPLADFVPESVTLLSWN
jgi:hypothetical protein